jgi:hypothetical protein
VPWYGWLITWAMVGVAGIWLIGFAVWALLVRKLWRATDTFDVDERLARSWRDRPDGWHR